LHLYTSIFITTTTTTIRQHLSKVLRMADFYTLKAEKPKGQTYDFESLKGKVVLIVNT
jgi:hypothetical protein